MVDCKGAWKKISSLLLRPFAQKVGKLETQNLLYLLSFELNFCLNNFKLPLLTNRASKYLNK